MAYTTPPTFADSTILTASQLNILSSDVEFLYSITNGMNIPFTSETVTSGSTRNWQFRRRVRYLHYKIRSTQNDTDQIDINVNGVVGYTDATNRIGPYTWSGYIDLTGITAVPAVGDFYAVSVDFTSLAGPNEWVVDYFIESSSTTL